MLERAVALAAVVCVLLGVGLALKLDDGTLSRAPDDETWRGGPPVEATAPAPEAVPQAAPTRGEERDEEEKDEKDDDRDDEEPVVKREKSKGKGKGRGG